MTKRLNRGKPIKGYTDTQTVKLDLDDVPFKTAKNWAKRTMEKFNLEGLIILKSSKNNYHVVFDCTVSWIENVSIMAWGCLISQNKGLLKWFLLQCIKGSSTLRVGPKGGKPSPRIVFRDGKQDVQIRNFQRYRRRIKKMIREIDRELVKKKQDFRFSGARKNGRDENHEKSDRRSG